jgi:hypothetical protein
MFNVFYRIFFNILVFLSLISLIGTIIYKIYAINFIIALIVFITALILTILLAKKTHSNSIRNYHNISNSKKEKYDFWGLISIILYIIPTLHCFFLLIVNSSSKSLVSPWEVLPLHFFVLFALSCLFLIINIIQNKKYALFLIMTQYFLFFGVALIIYKLGYGFDSFIHRATMELISEKSSINPKPFYYLGEYSLIIILHKITFISISFLEKILVPLFASIYIPLFSYKILKKWFGEEILVNLTILFLLILPLSFFIVTTPQSFAYIFLIIILLLGLNCNSIQELVLIYLLALNISCNSSNCRYPSNSFCNIINYLSQ